MEERNLKIRGHLCLPINKKLRCSGQNRLELVPRANGIHRSEKRRPIIQLLGEIPATVACWTSPARRFRSRVQLTCRIWCSVDASANPVTFEKYDPLQPLPIKC